MTTATEPLNADLWHIKEAWTINTRGREVRCGWDLFYAEDWSQRYATRRDAAEALHRVKGHVLVAGKWRDKATGYRVGRH